MNRERTRVYGVLARDELPDQTIVFFGLKSDFDAARWGRLRFRISPQSAVQIASYLRWHRNYSVEEFEYSFAADTELRIRSYLDEHTAVLGELPRRAAAARAAASGPEDSARWNTSGIAIEHEFRTTTDDFEDFAAQRSSRLPFSKGSHFTDVPELNVEEDPTVGRGYEVTTRLWKNKRAEEQAQLLLQGEARILNLYTEGHRKRKSVYPFAHDVRDLNSNSTSTGSYHFSFSIPYDSRDVSAAAKQRLVRFLRQLQWASPLLLSKVNSCAPQSTGDTTPTTSYAEGSNRVARGDVYGNLGGSFVSDFRSLPESKYSGRPAPYRTLMRVSDKHVANTGTEFKLREPFGVEWRVPDSFDAHGAEDFLKVACYVAGNAERELDDVPLPQQETSWNAAAASVIEEGWNAMVSKEYVDALRRALSVPILTGSLRAADVCSQLEKELWEKNKATRTAAMMVEDNSKQPRIHNFNKDSWNFMLKRKLFLNDHERKKFVDFTRRLWLLSHGSEWVRVAGTGGKSVRDLCELTLGKNYSAEDLRDVLDFFEEKNLIEVDRTAEGFFERVRVKLPTEDALIDAFNSVVADPSFFEANTSFEPAFEGTPAMSDVSLEEARAKPRRRAATAERLSTDELVDAGIVQKNRAVRVRKHERSVN